MIAASLHRQHGHDHLRRLGLAGEIRYLAATPITHAGGVNIFPMLMRGGFTRVLPGFDLESYCRTIEEEKINAVFLVPTLVYALIDAKEIARAIRPLLAAK